MLQIEIDGKELTVPQGSTVMDAANAVGIYIPHFCYHKKLSIAANCRMCLVEIEKAPKPQPACATPVTDGMKVCTHSEIAKKAQQGVMEFLLINHPLDCPICDQGGECQLQDLAVGYGAGQSRYQEEKRVVISKDMGPLVSAAEMARCIHCTRCVRFTEEVAGKQEIGQINRGEFAEIVSFVGKAVETELSGNVIDLCPVGALTSKPFRYSARSWELSRRKSIAPHDALGSNLIVQVKDRQVKRILPLENETINECWLSDRDRFSYEGLNSTERLLRPMIKYGGVWHEVEWQTALEYVVKGLKGVAADHGKDAIGMLVNPISTSEELFLSKKLADGFGIKNIDSRLRRQDFSLDARQKGALWLGQTIDSLLDNQTVFVIGSTLRTEQPLLSARLRQAVQKGLALNVLHAQAETLHMSVSTQSILHPKAWVSYLNDVLAAIKGQKTGSPAASNDAGVLAENLIKSEKNSIVLGAVAQAHPQFAELYSIAGAIAEEVKNVTLGILPISGNSVAAEILDVRPTSGNLNAYEMLKQTRKAYVLVQTEVESDTFDGALAVAAMKEAETVIAFTPYKGKGLLDYADVLLPIAPFTETAGSLMNMEGRSQGFYGVVQPLGETRPLWKVLRVLGNMLDLSGFEYNSVEDIQADELFKVDLNSKLNNQIDAYGVRAVDESIGLMRVGEISLYFGDNIVRRASSLQQTIHAQIPQAMIHSRTLAILGLSAGQMVWASQEYGSDVQVQVECDDRLPENVVYLAHHEHTQALGALMGAIELKRG